MIIYLFIFTIGVSIGSFLNVLIYRIPNGRKFYIGRSKCSSCDHELRWSDLIPIISFISIKGKCRYCRTEIPNRYWMVELLTGILITLFFYFSESTWMFLPITHMALYLITWATIISTLVTISFIDLDTMEIPNGAHIVLIICAIILQFAIPTEPFIRMIAGSLSIFIPLTIVSFLGYIGFGDVKLLFSTGLIVGLVGNIVGIMLSSFYALPVMLIIKAKRGQEVPYGPFLSLGIYTSALFAPRIIEFLTKLYI